MAQPHGLPGPSQGMQRAQPNQEQFTRVVYTKILGELHGQMGQFTGSWQATFDPRERATKIMQLITQLRCINPDVNKCLQIATQFEHRSITESQSKEQYHEKMQYKYEEVLEKRKQNAQMGQMNGGPLMQNNGMSMQNNGMGMQNMGMQNLGMQNGGMMNMPGNGMQHNGMGNIGFPNAGMGGQPGQMNVTPGQNPMFPAQLQRPMQPSPLPMQQPQQPQQQTPATMNPSALHMNQQQHGQQPAQQMRPQNMNQTGQPQPPGMQSGQGQPGQFPPINTSEAMHMAKQMYAAMPEESKTAMRQKFLSNMTEQQKAEIQSTGQDPLLRGMYQRAMLSLRQRAQGASGGSQQNRPGMPPATMNVPMGSTQRPPSQTESQNIDFSSIMGQQANALKLQESGEQVVPASNNNNGQNSMNGMGSMNQMGQMNVPQGINPQMLGNQNLSLQGMTPSQVQYLIAQQKDTQQREALQRQFMAQRQSMPQRQQNGQLQGQPGGLHTPNVLGGAPGQTNSPAMSMLNRPMVPPGQATPGTPQPNHQQPMAPTPVNGVSQLAQHLQNMQQNNQQQQQLNQVPPGQFNQLFASLSQEQQQKLRSMPPDRMQAFLTSIRAAQKPPNPVGMGNMQNMSNMNMAAPQRVQPGPNMMQQMGNAIPGFNSQPPQNQHAMQLDPSAQSQQRQQEQQRQIKHQAMDSMNFPKGVLTQLGIAVPPNVQRWGDLKMHLRQNMSTVPPGSAEKTQQLQLQWFNSQPGEFQNAIQNLMQQRRNAAQIQQLRQMQASQPSNQAPQQATSMPDRPPPAAQMVPPAPMMQAPVPGLQPGANGGQPRPQSVLHPTAQEIQMFRAKQPKAAGWDDTMIRHMIMQSRAQHARAQAQAQAQVLAQQRQTQAAMQSGALPRPSNQAGLGAQGNITNPNQPSQRPQPQNKQQSANDDVIEISSQAAKQSAPQATATQPSASQPQLQGTRLTQEQLLKMSPIERDAYIQKFQRAQQQQQQQMQSLRNAQGQLAVPNSSTQAGVRKTSNFTPAQQEHLTRIYRETMEANPKPKTAVDCDAAGMERAKATLKKLWPPLSRIAATFPTAMHLGFSEERIKEVFRWQVIVQQNATDAEGTIRDYLAVTPEQLLRLETDLGKYMLELRQRQQAVAGQNGAVAQKHSQQTSQQASQQAPAMAPSTSQQGHVRKASANAKAPPAPTEHKTFDWAAPSPHGIPKYETGRNELTPDKLKFPPNKKRKTGQSDSQASTPASPALGQNKGQNADMVRKGQQPSEQDSELQKFRCKDSTCDASVHGFDTEDRLRQHEQTQHQPIEDPLAFLLNNAANSLGVDADGKLLSSSPATGRDIKKEGHAKQEQRQLDGGVVNNSNAKLDKKQPVSDTSREKVEETLRDSLSKKMGIPAPPAAEGTGNVNSNAEMGSFWDGPLLEYNDGWPAEEDLASSMKEVEDVMNWQYQYCELVDPEKDIWQLRPDAVDSDASPDLTPASSQSSHASDIAQSDAMHFMVTVENFDDEIGVPESMIPLYHQVKQMMSGDDDMLMGGVGDKNNTEDVESAKKKKTQEANLLVQDFWKNYF